jgi:hypothetical protein
MAVRRTMTLTEGTVEPNEPAQHPPGQRQPPDRRPFRLKVDRQFKSSYDTYEDAEAAGMTIKKEYPILQVAIYDLAAGQHKILELLQD